MSCCGISLCSTLSTVIQMLAIEDASLAEKLDASRAEGARKVLEKNQAVCAKYNKA